MDPSTRERRYQRREKNKCLRSKIYANTIFSLFTFLFLLISVLGDNSYQIHQFENQPSVYFEKIGNVEFLNNYWQTIVYYNRSNYDVNLEYTRSNLKTVVSFCEKYNVTKCKSGLSMLQYKLKIIEDNDRFLSNKRRKKRRAKLVVAAAVAIGYGATWVYKQFTNDELESQINEIYENEERQQELLQNETIIVEGTVDLLKKQQEVLGTEFNNIYNRINAQNDNIRDLQANIVAGSLCLSLMNDLGLLENMQNVIMNSKSHLTQIISEQEVNSLIDTIEIWAHEEEQIPMYNSLHELMQLIEVRSTLTDSYIVFKLFLPLMKTKPFLLYHKYTVPVRNKENMFWLKTENEYFIINKNQSHQIELSEHELQACAHHQNYICPKSFYYRAAEDCISRLFWDEYLQSDSCKFELKKAQNYWVATEKVWIYSLRGKENLSIQCVNGHKTLVEIDNSGVLLLNEKCIANGSNG